MRRSASYHTTPPVPAITWHPCHDDQVVRPLVDIIPQPRGAYLVKLTWHDPACGVDYLVGETRGTREQCDRWLRNMGVVGASITMPLT